MKKTFPTIFIFAFALFWTATAHAAENDAFTFNFGEEKFSVSQTEIDSWRGSQKLEPSNVFDPSAEFLQNSISKFAGKNTIIAPYPKVSAYKLAPIYNYIQTLASSTINVPILEPNLKIEGGKVVEFTPPQTGRRADVFGSALDALNALQKNSPSVELKVDEVAPKKSLADTNDLGIKELIGHGVSSYKGSPNNRKHNIRVGVEKFQGLIVAKGEEFSFNKYLGPVEKENGFLPELVIKAEGTIPELGGGLCQVSSTTFRAAMAAGLPITQRRNHAYAVQYYSPQGTDATIYPGVIDLKFINDTPGAILVWPHFEAADTLIFDFYGSLDGRKVTLGKPVQYDRQTDGAMKATWTREVVLADGKERKDVFKSVYASPALYHKTEEFVSADGTVSGAPPGFVPRLAPPTGL